MSVLDKVRKWIDGDSSESVLEEAARDAQVKPRSLAEEFIVKLARAVEEVMQREMVPLPQGTTLIPSEYIIFLSEEDDKEWQGAKRRGLEQGLYHILAERAKEISGKKKLETQSFAVELRVDGTLEKGDFRVQHTWDDGASGKTNVFARPKAQQVQPMSAPPVTPPTPNVYNPQPQPQASPNFPPATIPQMNLQQAQQMPPETVAYQSQNIPQQEEELTRLNARNSELYKLEIWRGNVRQNVVPVYQNQIVIGRGSRSKPVDIALAGDPEISRRHITIQCDANGFYILVEGKNSILVNNFEATTGQRVPAQPGVPITVCSYILRIQPK